MGLKFYASLLHKHAHHGRHYAGSAESRACPAPVHVAAIEPTALYGLVQRVGHVPPTAVVGQAKVAALGSGGG